MNRNRKSSPPQSTPHLHPGAPSGVGQTQTPADKPAEATRREMIAYVVLGVVAVVTLVLFMRVGTVGTAIVGTVVIFGSRMLVVKLLTGRPLPIPSKNRTVVIVGPSNEQNEILGPRLANLWPDASIVVCQIYQKADTSTNSSSAAKSLKKSQKQKGQLTLLNVEEGNMEDIVSKVKGLLNEDMGLWSVLNLAVTGVGFDCPLGDADITAGAQYQQTLEALSVNIRLVKSFLPLLREKSGRLITVHTHHSRLAGPFCGPLNIYQAGLAAFDTTIRMELKRFRVLHCSIEAVTGIDIDKERDGRRLEALRKGAGAPARDGKGREGERAPGNWGVLRQQSSLTENRPDDISGEKVFDNKNAGTENDTKISSQTTGIQKSFTSNDSKNENELNAAKSSDNKGVLGDRLTRKKKFNQTDIFENNPHLLDDYGDEYMEYMKARRVERVNINHSGFIHAIGEALWNVQPKQSYTVKCSIRQTSFVQRHSFLSGVLPVWFKDQILMFEYKDSPLPDSAPDPHDSDDDD